jgi:glutaredoxin-like YruB-family protein
LLDQLGNASRSYLLLYKEGADQSDCALKNLRALELDAPDIQLMAANVKEVRDIHTQYGVNSVPTLLAFEDLEFKNLVKGCHEENFYKSYFENIIFELKAGNDDKPSKRVTVYTTPTCPWCTTVKNYLRKHGIRYSEVDVASDQSAAQSMVSKSGQQGVPQTEVNGEMVIGFDQAKLNRLLEIQSN